MKGYKKAERYDTKKVLSDRIIYKHLPYGKWTTSSNEEFLFNRDYEPIAGWNLETNSAIAVTSNMWIKDIVDREMYYGEDGIPEPIDSSKVLKELWDILANWSNRAGWSHIQGM